MGEIRIQRAQRGNTLQRVQTDNSGVIEAQGDVQNLQALSESLARIRTDHGRKVEERQRREGAVAGAAALSEVRGVMDLAQEGIDGLSVEELEQISEDGGQDLTQRLSTISEGVTNKFGKQILEQGLAQLTPQFIAGHLEDVEDRIVSLRRAEIAEVTSRGVNFGPRWEATLADSRADDYQVDVSEFRIALNASPYHTDEEKIELTKRYESEYLESSTARLLTEDDDRFVDVVRSGSLNGRIPSKKMLSFLKQASLVQAKKFSQRVAVVERASRLPDGPISDEMLQNRLDLMQDLGESLEEFRGDPAVEDTDIDSGLVGVNQAMREMQRWRGDLQLGSMAVEGKPVPVDPSDPGLRRGIDMHIRTQTMSTLTDPSVSIEEKALATKRAVRANGGQHPSIGAWMEAQFFSGAQGAETVTVIRRELRQELSDLYSEGSLRSVGSPEGIRGYSGRHKSALSSFSPSDLDSKIDAYEQRRRGGASAAEALQASDDSTPPPDLRETIEKQVRSPKPTERSPSIQAFVDRVGGGDSFFSAREPRPSNQSNVAADIANALSDFALDPPQPEPQNVDERMISEYEGHYIDALVANGGVNESEAADRAFHKTMSEGAWSVDYLDPGNPVWKRNTILATNGQEGFDAFDRELKGAVAFKSDGSEEPISLTVGVDRLDAIAIEDPAAPGGIKWSVSRKLGNGERQQLLFKTPSGDLSPHWFYDPKAEAERNAGIRAQEQRDRAETRRLEPGLKSAIKKFERGPGPTGLANDMARKALQSNDPEQVRQVTRQLRQDPRQFSRTIPLETFSKIKAPSAQGKADLAQTDEAIAAGRALHRLLTRQLEEVQRRFNMIATIEGTDGEAPEKKEWERFLTKHVKSDWNESVRRIGQAVEALEAVQSEDEKSRVFAIKGLNREINPLRTLLQTSVQKQLEEMIKEAKRGQRQRDTAEALRSIGSRRTEE